MAVFLRAITYLFIELIGDRRPAAQVVARAVPTSAAAAPSTMPDELPACSFVPMNTEGPAPGRDTGTGRRATIRQGSGMWDRG
jgi:hypothetical protein